MGKTLGWIGGLGTTAYIAGMSYFVRGRLAELEGLPLNSLGDFLAGAFGPIAFFWLVLGFFQQGHELSQQAKELKNSVEHQGELARIAKDQLAADQRALDLRAAELADESTRRHFLAQPIIRVNVTSVIQMRADERVIFDLNILNSGSHSCSDFAFSLVEEGREFFTSPVLMPGTPKRASLSMSSSNLNSMTARAKFVDGNGSPGEILFDVELSQSAIKFTQR